MPKLSTKLSEGQKIDIAERYSCGESQKALAKEFGVSLTSISKYCRREARKEPPLSEQRNTPATILKKFAQSARKLLWRQVNSGRKLLYNQWEARVAECKKEGMSDKQAIVQASKDFSCLYPLFLEYPVNEFDPDPDSHPHIHMHGEEIKLDGIECTGQELTHAENLIWAMNAAGDFLRTREPVTECPNNSAYFLYRQAIDDGDKFMAKYQQMAMDKTKNPEDESLKRGTQKSIAEIGQMLDTLEGEET